MEAFLSDPREAVIGFGLDDVNSVWSQATESLYGFPQTEILGKPISCLLPLYELPAHEDLLRNPTSAEPLVDALAERLSRNELRISVRVRRAPVRNASAEIIAVLERAHPLAPGGSCSVAEAQLRLLVEQIALFFWTTDLRLRVTSHWGRSASLARSFPRFPVGQTIYQYLRCQEDAAAPAKQHFLALRGVSSRLEYASRTRLFDLSIGPCRNPEGTIIGCIGM
ncbi:MAG TPA: PAS domain-containing protein, partial [Candidatus Limnocylindrales bacterium]|nr:PAS domain-containing protein [Candidatus Limnocylindrales bacterium]